MFFCQETPSNCSKYVPTSDYLSRYPRQTVTRMVAQYVDQDQVRRRQQTVAGYVCYYSDADARLLA